MTLHRGRIARDPTILNVRSLTRDDLMVLREPGRSHNPDYAGGSVIERFRDPHHRLARLIAAGLSNGEIAGRTGMSHSRISQHRNSPAFEDLIAKYRGKVDAAFEREQDEYAKLATGNMLKAESMLAEKLEEHEENGTLPPVRELIAISRDAADRFGYGKRQTNLNVNADFASMLEAARKRSAGANAKVIEGSVSPSPPPAVTAVAQPLSPQSGPVAVSPAMVPAQHPSLPLIRRRA